MEIFIIYAHTQLIATFSQVNKELCAACWTRWYTWSCTATISYRLSALTCKSICGGKSIWPVYKSWVHTFGGSVVLYWLLPITILPGPKTCSIFTRFLGIIKIEKWETNALYDLWILTKLNTILRKGKCIH